MRRALLVAGLLAAGLVFPSPAATAHALLQGSTPSNGEVLEASPREILLRFTEPPDHGLSQIRVLDSTGAQVETGPLEGVPGQSRDLKVAVPDLPDGTYTVSWRVLSTVDGHVTTGSFAFGVGVAPEPVTQPSGTSAGRERPTALAVGSRWTFYWGLALLVGGSVAGLFVFRSRIPAPWLLWLAWGAAAVGLVGMFLAERAEVGVSARDLLGSERGRLLLARAGAVLLALPATAVATRSGRRGASLALGGAAALAMLIHAYGGHAGAAEGAAPLHVGVQWLHIVSVGAWVGGLAWLLVGARGGPEAHRAGAARRFSALATVTLPVVAVTGLLRAINLVGFDPSRLLDSGFGLTVLGKGALFLGLVGLGAYNRYRIVPRISSGRIGILRRTVAAELFLGAAIFGLTGVMAGLPPPAQTPEAPPPARVVARGSDPAGLLHVRLTVSPGTPGINRFEVQVTDDEGQPEDATGVRLSFSLPSRPEIARTEVDLEPGGDGWRGEGPNLSVYGSWEVGVLVLQEGDSRTVDLELRTRLPSQNLTVAEGDPPIYTIRLPSGISVQAFVEPGTPGPNEIHLTFLTPEGAEQPMDLTRFEGLPASGNPVVLDPVELSPGHFVAQQQLTPGRWTFFVEASTPDDATRVTAHFQEEVAE